MLLFSFISYPKPNKSTQPVRKAGAEKHPLKIGHITFMFKENHRFCFQTQRMLRIRAVEYKVYLFVGKIYLFEGSDCLARMSFFAMLKILSRRAKQSKQTCSVNTIKMYTMYTIKINYEVSAAIHPNLPLIPALPLRYHVQQLPSK